MCGIAGMLGYEGMDGGQVVLPMVEAIRYRGPDDMGVWCDNRAGIALGHARLSILDLSASGHQPMVSADGRYVISYNGEIYNFAELRKELESRGTTFRGHSDTEVLLEAISRWGFDAAVRRFYGMFAFAVWDRETRTLFLGRDRLGEKPLYYGWAGNTFLFASELKALRAFPSFEPEIDRNALALLLRYNYVPTPHSIYQGIQKLPAGTLLSVQAVPASTKPKPVPYWSLQGAVERGEADPFVGSDEEAIAQLDRLLSESVLLRMVADVPLGAFLSGGVDSSTVVALMQTHSRRPVKTFTIGFHEAAYDEAHHAERVARHLGTEHTQLYVTPAQARAVIAKLPVLYDEPFADVSQIPTFLVSQLARREVTVGLSGDGGDEIFGGYSRYCWGHRIWRNIAWMPAAVRTTASRMLNSVSPGTWDALFGAARACLPRSAKVQHPGDKLQKLAGLLTAGSQRALYAGLVSIWREPEQVVLGATEPATAVDGGDRWLASRDFREAMMFWDTTTYLPDDILAKVDRASMGVSLETRLPILDHSIVEFAWRLPLSMKIRRGRGKWLLQRVLEKYVPAGLIDRPKMGFGVPIDSWLRGPLRDCCEALLDGRRLRDEGFFNPGPIRQKWTEHLSGRRNWQYLLWGVLMFQMWREQTK
jgi:asparagine synthase (glutamine-hydrolysing)